MATVIDLLPRLPFGLDVNVKFDHVRKFEFTPSITIFDLFGIALLHGWLVDPEARARGVVGCDVRCRTTRRRWQCRT